MTYVLTKVDKFFSKVHFDLSLNFVVEEATGDEKQSDICTRSSIGFTPSSAEYRKLYKANRGDRLGYAVQTQKKRRLKVPGRKERI